MCLDFRRAVPVASASDTALDRRHPVYTVEGYARGGETDDHGRMECVWNWRKGWRKGAGGWGWGGEGNLRPSARVFPRRRGGVSRLRLLLALLFRALAERDGLLVTIIWKTMKRDPPPLPPPSSSLFSTLRSQGLRFTPANLSPRVAARFYFALPTQARANINDGRRRNLRRLHSRRNDFILFLVSRFSALC